ncbi:hypothetical protein BRADI_3g39340v3 [Brachypodium distachyon]|uniref:WRKY domain-containing protein n=1 Tax=Brachypodium distachyon TaxID=15368 RepID=A0A0Q3QAW1_BRADI|nr:hypothetical protein BRADI_3g39340v3 [Brachypodium distachyon]
MSGTGKRGALTEDWMLPTPSPRTLMLSLFNEDLSSGPCSDVFGDNKPQDGIDGAKPSLVVSSWEETTQVVEAPPHFEPNLFGAKEKPISGSSLAERMAPGNGLCALQIDTSRVGSSVSIRSPVVIPPGVSPRELLESPVFLPNAIAQPSPTTGKLPFLMRANANLAIPSVHKKDEDLSSRDGCTIFFQPILRPKPPIFPTTNKTSVGDNRQDLSLQSSSTATKDVTRTTSVKPKKLDFMFDNDHPIPIPDKEQEECDADRDGNYSLAPVIAAEDGYNWRKYGQKQVKNSDHPRSYYKCSHPNCPVKKKVERCQDGHITEIVYKGSHNHPLPPPSHHFQDVHGEILGTKLSASLNTADQLADISAVETREAVDSSPVLSNEDDNKGTHGTVYLGFDGGGDATGSKRRKMDSVTSTTAIGTIDIEAMASRAVQEPRVIVQTTSDVDILDDGYRWRKYGQKVVKGNPNPRSYYRCTHPGCSVRKHVERASNDPKSVITTYEGKHDHEVPAARNTGSPSSGPGGAPPAPPQANILHRSPEPAQGRLSQSGGLAAYGSTGRSGVADAFSSGMLPHGIAVLAPPLGTFAPSQISGHPPAMQGYARRMPLTGEEKVNPAAQHGKPATNRTTAYQQLMGRLSQDPQM